MLEVPGRAEVRQTGERLPLETVFQVVRKSRPNDYIESFSSASERDSFELKPNKALNFRSYSPAHERFQTFVDPYTGKIICQYNYNHRFLQKIYDPHDNLLALVRLVTPIHYGDVGGLPTRILWIAVGLTPAVLFVTSVLMWWNRSLSRRWSRDLFTPPLHNN